MNDNNVLLEEKIINLTKNYNTLQIKLSLAMEALMKYGDCWPTCPAFDSNVPCECGFEKSLEQINHNYK